jgi:UrcA family protein
MKIFKFDGKQALAAAAAAFLACAAAHADAFADAAPTRTIRYTKTDLGTQAATEALYRRIRVTAEAVCGNDEVDHRRLDQMARVNACIRNAIAEGVQAVNDERLTHEYALQFGEPKNLNVAALR